MHLKTLVLILLLGFSFPLALAQQEEPLAPIPPKRTRAAKVGAFGGFTPGWLSVDVAPINAFLQPAGGAPLKANGVFLTGGAGAAYIMLLPNIRVGGMGMSGSIRSTALSATGVRRDAELSVGFGGVTLEYVIPVIERLDVAVGGMLGWGGIDLTLRQDNGGAKTWQQEWDSFRLDNYGNNTTNITRRLSGAYFVYVPTVHVEYAILGWFGARVGASYVGMAAPSWELDGRHELLGVPGNVSGQGFMVSAGVFVGTF
jgi:hypothetical protein